VSVRSRIAGLSTGFGLALVWGALLGCSGPPERLEVVTGLAEARSAVALLALGPDEKVVGEDYRPSFETPRQRPLSRDGEPTLAGTTLRQSLRPGPLVKGLPLLIERIWKLHGEAGWRTLAPVRVVPEDRPFELVYEIGEGVDPAKVELSARAFLVPPMPRSRVLDDLVVGEGFALVGAFGLDPVARGLARRPVVFRIVARVDDDSHVLFEDVRDPASAASFRWSEFRISLDRFVGKTVHIEVSSALRLEPGDDPAQEVGFPAWSVPTVIAPQPPEQREVRNVVLISLDTLRADYVGAYGQPLATTPNLDRLASEGALFETVYTTYPSTTASHMSMLTGLYPEVHGVYGPTHSLPPMLPILAEVLRGRRYRTAAVTEDAMLAAAVGFHRGFDSYREYKSSDRLTEGHVGEVVDDALAWLEKHHRERFFLFLHTYQVHGPYTPPPAYDVFTAQPPGLKEEFAAVRRGYAGDLLYTDAEIGRLLAGLDALGETERTIVVVTADHGEELGDHGVVGHTWYVTDPVLRIPLLVRAPGLVPAGLRIAGTASLVDVAPTILDLAGGVSGASTPAVQGTSLVRWLADPAGASRRDRVVFAEQMTRTGHTRVMYRGREKWRVGGSPGEAPAFFDLRASPIEHAGAADAARVAEGRALLERHRAATEEIRITLGRPKAARAQVDDVTQQKLRALGYVEE